MKANPFVKPRVVTGWLVVAIASAIFCFAFSTSAMLSSPISAGPWLFVALSGLFVAAVGSIWFLRLQRANKWTARAVEQWRRLEAIRLHVGTTTEVTILAIETVEPTGTWVTLRWNHFDHVQRAWMEALPDEIWEGAVLLISPDPTQISVRGPWPPIYYLHARSYHGFAPAAARADFDNLWRRRLP
ncbi:hypothetical protein NG702_18790 [Pseudarthrobacter sp. MDT3-28]|uniref:hypothetical protein n=1 Tax=Pseudarthrobacter raffinosi TaxID=2953651 RepID=UPI00208FA209|nr:hypothetical protein [Pseudarthrobacter sp. MDT3-28]MCO4239427.1 hypothetical protein [Pseudarthrobacter sp. MDT3-28]